MFNLLTSFDPLCRYRFNGMFSLAVTIPQNQNQNQDQNIQEVLTSDPANSVKNKINQDEVYVGSRMVAAKVLKREFGADHAESRVVDNLNQLVNRPHVNDFLLFYVYASPCVEKCTSSGHTQSILSRIMGIRNWNSYAFVFSKIFKPKKGPGNTDEQRIHALQRLAGSIGLENIFRCDRQNNAMQCVCCSSNGQVTHECVSDDPPSASTNIQGNAGRGRGSNNRPGGRVRRDISSNTGDSSSQHISESNKGAEDAPSVDGNGNDVATGEAVSVSPPGSDDGNGSDLKTAEDVSSPQTGIDSGDGNGKVSRGKGRVSKGKGGKGRKGKRGKRGKGKGRRGKGKGRRGKGKGRRGKGKGRRGKGKGSRRGGRSRRRGLDQEWIFANDF